MKRKQLTLYHSKSLNVPIYIASEVDKAISELEAQIPRWRKFPDEKPTKDIKFLVINEKGMLQCCYYSLILKEFQIPVTHWMPLPKAPEEDK